MVKVVGITDNIKNPFALESWIKQGFGLTLNRQDQLRPLLGKTLNEILSINRNEGRYPAFVAIRWGFADLINNRLEPTEKWINRELYSNYGEFLTKGKRIKLVRNWDDILKNIGELESYRHSKNTEDVEYYISLIKRGTCFVATKIDEKLVFAPSRFIGYLKNSREKHIANKTKDGRISNPKIEKILNIKFRVDEGLERAYRSFCLSLGFTPRDKGSFGVTRKYILKDVFPFIPKDFLLDDISEIEKQDGLRETEKQQLVNARLGQGAFRESLFSLWGGCSVTKCKEPSMLRASHIKPWRLCNNKERLDPYNGLLLIPNFDLAFDNGLMTFNPEGKIIISNALVSNDSKALGISENVKINLHPQNEIYMKYHRKNIFKK